MSPDPSKVTVFEAAGGPREPLIVTKLDIDTETAAIRKYQEKTLANGDNPWHNLIFYRDGERLARLRCREFSSDAGKRAAFGTMALLTPVIGADEVMWMANVSLTMVKIDAEDINAEDIANWRVGRSDDSSLFNLLNPQSTDLMDALMVCVITPEHASLEIMPYHMHRNNEIHWFEEVRQKGADLRRSAFDSEVIETVQKLLVTPVHDVALESVVWALTHGDLPFEYTSYLEE